MLSTYRDLGVVANAEEPRTSCLVFNGSEYFLVICSKGFVMLVNLNQETAVQIPFPENYIGYPFGSLAATNGKVYLGAGTMFMEFDPASASFSYYEHIHPEAPGDNAWCFAEAPDGEIYFGAHPQTWLTRYNPFSRKLTDCGILDSTQSYVGTMAFDRFGYLYCVIGTQTYKVVVWNSANGEKKILSCPQEQQNGAAVSQGRNGEVYVSFSHSTLTCEQTQNPLEWYRVEHGTICARVTDPSVCNNYRNSGFYTIHSPYNSAPEILSIDLEDHQLYYRHPITSQKVKLMLEYQTEGADMSPLTLGPNGRIYGTTNHPIQLYTYSPESNKVTNYGKSPFSQELPKDAWGNICAYAAQGDILSGCAYCGGFVVRIDTQKEISRKSNINPTLEAAYDEIYRPRCALACKDGETVLFGGFPPNGQTGGGMVVYHTLSRSSQAIANNYLLLHHSILCMAEQCDGRVFCGTTIEAPCGGYVYEKEASLFLFDWKSRRVLYQCTPVANASAISLMKIDDNHVLHGITAESIYFAFDCVSKKTLYTQDLSAYGSVVRDGMQTGKDGCIYGLLEHGIYRILIPQNRPEIVSVPPCDITAGMALTEHTVYFGSYTHLWSCCLKEPSVPVPSYNTSSN